MVRELFYFPMSNKIQEILCFDAQHERFFIRSTDDKGNRCEMAITPVTANILMLYAQLNRNIDG